MLIVILFEFVVKITKYIRCPKIFGVQKVYESKMFVCRKFSRRNKVRI